MVHPGLGQSYYTACLDVVLEDLNIHIQDYYPNHNVHILLFFEKHFVSSDTLFSDMRLCG